MKIKYRYLIYLVLFVCVLIIWEYFSRGNSLVRLYISSPSLVVNYFLENSKNLLYASAVTFFEAFSGLLIATLFSFGVMILCFYKPEFLDFILPIMIGSQVVPVIVLAPFFIIFFGLGLFSKIAMAAVISFFPIFLNFFYGYKSISKNIHELMDVYKTSKTFRIDKIYFPLSFPSIITGLKVSSTLAIIGAIVAEFTGAKVGIGKNLFVSAIRLEPEMMIASLFLATVTGFILYGIIVLIDKLFICWNFNN